MLEYWKFKFNLHKARLLMTTQRMNFNNIDAASGSGASSCLSATALAQAYFVCPVEGRAKYCRRQERSERPSACALQYFALPGAAAGRQEEDVIVRIGVGVVESAELQCSASEAGPSYESLQSVFNTNSFRPTFNYSRPTSVNISFTIYAVLGVNEKTQILTTFLWLRLFWQHEFLTWTPAKCGSVEKISLPIEDIWTPDIIVYEFIDEDKSQRTPFVYVNHTGRVRYDKMLRVVSSCNLGIFNFPFDVQNCSLTFGSYMHTVRDVRLGLALPVEQILQNSLQYLETSGEWELLRIEGGPDILKFGIDEWDIITFWVVIRRRPVLYVVNLIIPSAFLMLIDILSFFLPPHSTDRASFKMTLLLGYTVFLLIMNDLLPSTANGTPLIGIYFSVCLALLVLSLLETVIITHVLHRGTLQNGSVPFWVRKFVLCFLAQLICYSDPNVNHDSTSSNNNVTVPPTNEDASSLPPPSPSHDKAGITETTKT
ncbi:unnamed protein product [Ranitomeya imitator]|uniref:5-hydroxytryptamine receptor 3A n=1 Tax=Ranitomeya imitator TaxID=111125 RepID=A0ABN9MEY5_9NEOB|nr:unnamed protein product [Ranitomeya imitator]